MVKHEILKFRPCVELFVKKIHGSENEVTASFLFQDSREQIEFQVTEDTVRFFQLIDGINTIGDLCKIAESDIETIGPLIQTLFEYKLIEVFNTETKYTGSFERQVTFLSNFSDSYQNALEMQEKIESAHVVIIGLGGIGSWNFDFLARAGVKTFTLIDSDTVELSNLHRQSIYTSNDVAKFKVCVLSEWHKNLFHGESNVTTIQTRITSSADLFKVLDRNYSIIINCADEPDVEITNQIVSDYCFATNTPYIVCGGYDGHLSFIGQTVIPRETSCWNCYVESDIHQKRTQDYTHIPLSKEQAKGGTIAPIASMTASIQSLEALRLITGFSKPKMFNRRGEYDFASMSMNYIDIPTLPNCTKCGEKNEICSKP